MPDQKSSLGQPKLDRWVLGVSGVFFILFIMASLINIDLVSSILSSSLNWVTSTLGSVFAVIVFLNVLVCIYLIFSKLGSIRLGKLEKPEMSTFSWISILFCSAIAAGAVFYGPGEPLTFFSSVPPLYSDTVQNNTQEAAVVALQYSYLHWGFSAWCIYGIFVIATMVAVYHKGLPFKPSSAFYFLIGEKRVKGFWGKAIDIFSTIAVVGGVMASVGLLVIQLGYMLEEVYGIPDNSATKFIILFVIVATFTISCITGVFKGITKLSRWNVYLAIVLAAAIFLLGPSQFILDIMISSFGGYLQDFVKMSLYTDPVEKSGWLSWWSSFYWAWWIGWGPAIGLFFARVSRGRTIREILIAGLSISGVSLIFWFAILGGTGIWFDIKSGGEITKVLATNGMESALLSLLNYLPLSNVFIIAFLIAIVLFLVTTADSVALSASIVVTGSDEPSRWIRLFWGLVIGGIAAILLHIGGLSTLQTGAIITAPPIALMLLLLIVSIPRQLKQMVDEECKTGDEAERYEVVKAKESLTVDPLIAPVRRDNLHM
ncbi:MULTISPECIES: BCCT family transporter [unclassified Paenibacillus]|uniref:BCCT family transporter n=1 Tax=unclassified Paenibacillus TaxID=185978 RepID=UPI001AE52597|nr:MULTISPECIES: BCCT family transporter [unclassified Paenibacillus]